MLKERVITASVLAVGFLAALFLLSWAYFSAFMGAVLLIAVWEWAGLSALSSLLAKGGYVCLAVAVSAASAWYCAWGEDVEKLRLIFIASCTWWALALLWIQSFPSSSVIWGSVPVRLLMGLCVLVPAWLGFAYLSREPNGAWLVLFVVLIVAAADIGAYFSGRAFGKRKLAPKVSPGKSWEGVVGGAIFATIFAITFNAISDVGGWQSLLIVAIPTALVSVVGDLLESMVKRHRGVKDSGRILPGHGGILDRIDGLVAAIPVFTLVFMSCNWQI